MMTNADLRRLTKEYGRRYFRGKLPLIDVRFSGLADRDLGICLLFGGVAEIRIAKELRRWTKQVKLTLLHELVYAYLPPRVQHGPRFEREMREARAIRSLQIAVVD